MKHSLINDVLSLLPDHDEGQKAMPHWRMAYLLGVKISTIDRLMAEIHDMHLSHKPIVTSGRGRMRGTFMTWDGTLIEEKLQYERRYRATRERRIEGDILHHLKNA